MLILQTKLLVLETHLWTGGVKSRGREPSPRGLVAATSRSTGGSFPNCDFFFGARRSRSRLTAVEGDSRLHDGRCLCLTNEGDLRDPGIVMITSGHPPGANNTWTSWLYTVRAENWHDASTWSTNATPQTGLEKCMFSAESFDFWWSVS